MRRLFLIIVLALAASIGFPAAASAQPAGDPYQTKVLTDQDFLLYFQFMELSRHSVDSEALASFASQNNLAPGALSTLAARIDYGRLIIENPAIAESLVAAHGPAVNPSDQERLLFDKYAEDIRRIRSAN